MKVRYASQRDKFRCGPYAVLNALKWAGWDYSAKKHLKKLCKLVNCKPTGTSATDMLLGILKIQQKFKTVSVDTDIEIKDLNKHLRARGSAIIDIRFYKREKKKWQGHWIFIESLNKRGYKVVNYSSKNTVSLVKPWNLKREITNNSKLGYYASCWLFEKW